VPALDALVAAGHDVVAVFTQPDRPSGRGRELTASTVKTRALELGIPVAQPSTLKGPDAIAHLRQLTTDAMVVVAYGLLLPAAVLEIPRLGCINIHASLLPRWRGAAPIQRAILAGDAETGVTIMQMDAGLDTGPMLLMRTEPISATDTSATLHDRLSRVGAEAVVEALAGLASGELSPRPQPELGATYAPKIEKREAVIDWKLPAERIGAMVRAFNPWPVAQTTISGETLRIWGATPLSGASRGASGEIVSAAHGEFVVATGAGELSLMSVQLPGRRAVPAAEFLNAWRGEALVGQRLGAG
jgi:methionyl-tRNA formyltransferase